MFTHEIEPRFSETDALGHINNTCLPVWFEEGRGDLVRLFNPDLELKHWNLILKKYDIEFIQQIFHASTVTIHTEVEHVGDKSLVVYQEALQNGITVAIGHTVLVYFDFSKNTTAPIPSIIKERLASHMKTV